MAARSDARKRREEPAVDPVERALELLADALANAVRLGLFHKPVVESGVASDYLVIEGRDRLLGLPEMINSRLEPF